MAGDLDGAMQWASEQQSPLERDDDVVPVTDPSGRFVVAYRYRGVFGPIEWPIVSMAEAVRNA